MSKKCKSCASKARSLIGLLRSVEQYFRHPDAEQALGYQDAMSALLPIDEVAWYLQDHVVDEEGEGLTARDRKTIASELRKIADLLDSPGMRQIPFALRSTVPARQLRKAADDILKEKS